MANYINPFTDIGFKRIFGQEFSKPLLIDFLNNLLIGEKRIVDFEKGVVECENDFDRWIYVLKNMETIKRLPYWIILYQPANKNVPRLYLRISHFFRQLGKYFSPIWGINCPKWPI